ncbi:hypothetical protein ACHHYP_04532 [Achlya hypogyna]|uniref:Uncharacterized protein n=1 Tax=Achlya hypogyna TaxID=1202772 RepID=A0A1V9Z0X3_ACHHY|nr:hypothetical protein ACHHYP_04532 [Achlya hypogyna]
MANWADIDAVHHVVLAFAGPLTQLLHGCLPLPLSEDVILDVWNDVFCCDWQGNLADLPPLPAHRSLGRTLRSIQTRSMYHRVKTDTNYSEVAYVVEYATKAHRYEDETVEVMAIADIEHVPMQHMWLDELSPMLATPVVLAHASIAGGHVKLLEHLVAAAGVSLGSIGLLRRYDGEAMDIAAYYNHMDMLQLLHEGGCNACTSIAMQHAAYNGNLEMVQWLHTDVSLGCTSSAFVSALDQGHREIADFLRELYAASVMFYSEDIERLVLQGRLDALTYIVTHLPAMISSQAIEYAAMFGRLDILKVLCNSPYAMEIPTAAMLGAASHGHLEIIQFLHQRCPEGFTTRVFDAAARNNHMDIVLFLHSMQRGGFSINAMDRAAHRGHMEMVRFLHEHGTDGCTKRAMDWAAAGGHLAMVQYLHEKRTEGYTHRALYWAAREGHIDVLNYLLQLDTDKRFQQQAVRRALRIGHKVVFDSLRTVGAVSARDLEVAAQTKWLPVLYRIRSKIRAHGEVYGDDDLDAFEDAYNFEYEP